MQSQEHLERVSGSVRKRVLRSEGSRSCENSAEERAIRRRGNEIQRDCLRSKEGNKPRRRAAFRLRRKRLRSQGRRAVKSVETELFLLGKRSRRSFFCGFAFFLNEETEFAGMLTAQSHLKSCRGTEVLGVVAPHADPGADLKEIQGAKAQNKP